MKLFRSLFALVLAFSFIAPAFGQDTPATVKFPAALDTADSLIRAANSSRTTLSGSVNASVTTITVASTSTFPASGAAVMDNEIFFYAAKTPNTFTGVVRGADDTTAATHASGATVRSVIAAANHTTHSTSIINTQTKVGTGASVPSSGSVLRGTGAGTSAWGALTDGDLPGTFTSKAITGTLSVSGDTTLTGGLQASNFNVVGALKGMLEHGLVRYSPDYIKGMYGFYDAHELDLTQGDKLATWPDLSGNGRDGSQPVAADRMTYDASEVGFSTTETDGAFVLSTDTSDHISIPIPADETKTVFIVAKRQVSGVGWRLANFNTANYIYATSGNRWAANGISGAGGTTPKGYHYEWSVLAWRQNSATSISFFVDGELAQTYTPQSNPGAISFFNIGPGASYVRQVGTLDYALSDAQVAEHTAWLRTTNGLTWRHIFIDVTGGEAPTLPSHGLIVVPEGFKGKRPLVFLNHTYLNNERLFLDNTSFQPILRALLDKGYIVAISRMYASGAGDENSWGNQQALDANDDLYDYAVANLQVDTSRVAMVGFSMGGLATALAFPDGQIPLDGMACFDCVLDLAHVYSTFFTATINTAYNIPGGGTYAAQTAGHDPRLVAASNWSGKRLRFYSRVTDTVVDPTQNTADFRTQVAGVATESGLYTLTGDHLEGIDSTAIADLMAFLARVLA